MRVTAKTNLAMRALMFCAVNTDLTVQKSQIAKATNASENHLAQIIQALSHAGIVTTRRGRGGGLELGHPATEISVGEVFRALEANLPFAECYDPKKNTCPLIGRCRLRHAFDRALMAFYAELDTVTLDDLVRGNMPLTALLSLSDGLSGPCSAEDRITV